MTASTFPRRYASDDIGAVLDGVASIGRGLCRRRVQQEGAYSLANEGLTAFPVNPDFELVGSP